MKHRNRNLALWLCSCFLLPHSVARAQISFLAALSRPANVVGQTARPNATSPITVPAGTHLLMKLTCPLHTTSATAGSGVHLETSSPVIADDRIAIPEKTHVFGVGEKNRRPGRMHGRARLRMRFTQFILPDDRVLAISGNLQSLPGSAEHRTTDEQGTLEPVDQIDGDVYTVASTTGLGVLIGSIGHIGIGGRSGSGNRLWAWPGESPVHSRRRNLSSHWNRDRDGSATALDRRNTLHRNNVHRGAL